jgi:hypothetical protein
MATVADRFLDFVLLPEDSEGCWLWIGLKEKNGYGILDVNGKTTTAHRFSYEIAHGPAPTGFDVGHLCNNKSCVNPLHLKAMTTSENILMLVAAGNHNQARKTHCPKGHEYTSENTTTYQNNNVGSWRRGCRICSRAKMRARRARSGY